VPRLGPKNVPIWIWRRPNVAKCTVSLSASETRSERSISISATPPFFAKKGVRRSGLGAILCWGSRPGAGGQCGHFCYFSVVKNRLKRCHPQDFTESLAESDLREDISGGLVRKSIRADARYNWPASGKTWVWLLLL
jgi:hypothetical protein